MSVFISNKLFNLSICYKNGYGLMRRTSLSISSNLLEIGKIKTILLMRRKSMTKLINLI